MPPVPISPSTSVLFVQTTSNSGSLVLPLAASIPGRVVTIKDSAGATPTNNVTINTSGSDTFENGQSYYTLNQGFGYLSLVAGSDDIWYIIGGTYINDITIQKANVSSIAGDGRGLYNLNAISSLTLQSTVQGVMSNAANMSVFQSSIVGLGSAGYISSSTFVQLMASSIVSKVYSFSNIYTEVVQNAVYQSTIFNWIASGDEVAGNSGGSIRTSIDGKNWSVVSSNLFAGGLTQLIYAGGKYVAVGRDLNTAATSIKYSTNGSNWTNVGAGNNILHQVNYIAYNGSNLFVAGGSSPTNSNTLMYSADAITWYPGINDFSGISGAIIYSVAYGNGVWVAGGVRPSPGYTMLYSTDGSNWNNVIGGGGFLGGSVRAVLYHNSKWYAGGYVPTPGNTTIRNSADGSNWYDNQYQFDGKPSISRFSVAGPYIFAGSAPQARTSYTTDGSNWNLIPSFNIFLASVAYNGSDLYVGVGQASGGLQPTMLTSINGLTWSSNTTGRFNIQGTSVLYNGYSVNISSIASSNDINVTAALEYTQNGLLLNNSRIIDQSYFTSSLTSSVYGVLENVTYSGYLTTVEPELVSTVTGLNTSIETSANNVYSEFISTLGSGQFVSTLSLVSTVVGLGSAGFISSVNNISTSVENAIQSYASTLNLASTVSGLLTGNTDYLTSTVAGLITFNNNDAVSTIEGLGSAGYISSVASFDHEFSSTVKGLGSAGYISSVASFDTMFSSTVQGLGSAGYVSTQSLVSSIDYLINIAPTIFHIQYMSF